MVSSLLNVSSTIMIFTFCILSLSHKSFAITQELVNNICSHARPVPKDPNTCYSILNGDPRTKDVTMRALLENVFTKLTQKSNDTQNYMATNFNKDSATEIQHLVRDCQGTYTEFDRLLKNVVPKFNIDDPVSIGAATATAGNAIAPCRDQINVYPWKEVLFDLNLKNEELDVLVDMVMRIAMKVLDG